MFGLRFIKAQPTDYVIQFRNGRPLRDGAGLSMFYFAPTSSLVLIPTASVDEPFMFEEVTADYQDITVQGQVTSRIADPRRTAALLNFALNAKGRYASDDPEKLSQRPINQVQVAMRLIEQEEITGRIGLEERNGELVGLATANARQEAKAYGIDAMMKAFAASDAKVLQALASVGMQPAQLLALAFRDLADNAAKIGQLNVSPDLLREIMGAKAAKVP